MTYYDFLLDFFPLVDEITCENPVLGGTLQVVALEGILNGDDHAREKLKILLKLSVDLGYTSPEVVHFLMKELKV